MSNGIDLSKYVTVPDRIARFYAAHPDGRLQASAPRIITIDDRTFLEVTAKVYRDPDDPCPTIGTAWEPFPGRTPYTRDSEAMNAETSAVGRALGLAGFGAAGSVASYEEVQARRQTGIPRPQAKGRIMAAAQGNADAAREAWSLVMPDDPLSVDADRLEAAEQVARRLVDDSDTPSETELLDVAVGMAQVRATLENLTAVKE